MEGDFAVAADEEDFCCGHCGGELMIIFIVCRFWCKVLGSWIRSLRLTQVKDRKCLLGQLVIISLIQVAQEL